MDTYIVLLHYDYEGDHIEGVFSTEQKAKDFITERENKLLAGSLQVVKWAVDNPRANYNGLNVHEIC